MRSIQVAGLGATGLVLLALGLRASMGDAGPANLPDRLVPGLIAAAAMCIAGLTIRRAPSVAWFAITIAAAIGAVEVVAFARAVDATPAGDPWISLTILATLASLVATAIGATYAALGRAGRATFGAITGLAAATTVAVTAGHAWAVASALGEAGRTAGEADVIPIRIATRVMLVAMAGFLLVGGARDLIPPIRRAWRRRAPEGVAFARLLAEELLPSWAGSGRAGAERERERLAADLHARVLPELRSALAATVASDPAGDVSERLRSTVDDVEALMTERHSLVLQEFGLLAALEWLAERIEGRERVPVTITVGHASAHDAGPRPPRSVERAAFRVALLAVDNAARHAAGSPIEIRASIAARAVAIDVADGGPGISPEAMARAAESGRRGIPDMRAEAAGVGASLVVGREDASRTPAPGERPALGLGPVPGPGAGPGSRVAFRWPAART